VLQAIGTALMLGGSFITQGNAGKSGKASALLPAGRPIPTIPSQEELAPPEPKSTKAIPAKLERCPCLKRISTSLRSDVFGPRLGRGERFRWRRPTTKAG
jgi:hypothetical protein